MNTFLQVCRKLYLFNLQLQYNALDPPLEEDEEENLSEEEKRQRFIRATLHEAANKIACIIVSQPFQV